MAFNVWKQTFKDGTDPLKNAAVTVYLANSTVEARVFDEGGVLHEEAPQLKTDITGQLIMQIDPLDYPVTTLFDIHVEPDPLFNPESETQKQFSIPIQATGMLQASDWPDSGIQIDLDNSTIKLNDSSGNEKFTASTTELQGGDYDGGGPGFKIDYAAGTFETIGLDLSLDSIPGLPTNRYCFLDAEFTEGYGTTVHDGSRTHTTGTLVNTPTWSGIGILGNCLKLESSSSQYANFGTNAVWDVTAPYDLSWSFWLCADDATPSSNQGIMAKGVQDTAGWEFILLTTGIVRLRVNKSGDSTSCNTTVALTNGVWSHYAFVYHYGASDDATVDIYVNGEFDRTVSSVSTMADGAAYSLIIGARNGPTAYLDGYVQGFKIYKFYALTADEVRALYKYPQGARGGQLTARSAMIGAVPTTTGWVLNDEAIQGKAAGNPVFAVALTDNFVWDGEASAIDTGDIVWGRYFSQGKGLWFDASADTTYFKGRLAAASISTGDQLTVAASNGILVDTGGEIKIQSTGALNISAGSSTWSGGTINITGTTVNIDGGTLTVKSGNQITIDSGGKIRINSVNGVEFGSTATLYADTLFFIDAGSNNILLNGGTVYTHTNILPYTITPPSDNIGSSSYYFTGGYFYRLFAKGEEAGTPYSAISFDNYDDLDIVSRYGGSEMTKGWQVLPIECTNIQDLANEENVTVNEVMERDDLQARIFYDPLMVGIFSLGAIKQLYSRVKELEKKLKRRWKNEQ